MSTRTSVLVVDDDGAIRYTLEAVLSDAGFLVRTAVSAVDALALLELHAMQVVLTDYAMPGMDGMQLLEALRTLDPGLPAIMLTAHGSERVAVAAMKAGAFDYLPKPFDPDEVVLTVKRAAEVRALRLENARLRSEAALGRPIVAVSSALRRALDMVIRVAPKDVTVLIAGESGSGKEVLATTLHTHSRRSSKPLVRFNAAAIPLELAESELFGHVRGAFTGAHENKKGYFQLAHGGTLFIDEIGDLPLSLQAKVLRVMQSGEVQIVGGKVEIVDVRVIAATHRNLQAEVRAGKFREDLYYRLNVVPIRVPPLRERVDDIEPLVRSFMQTYGLRYGMNDVQIEPALMDALRTHMWPGNVRELENTVARLLALAPTDLLTFALWRSFDEPTAQVAGAANLQAAIGDPGSGFPLRARVESFERALIAAEYETAKGNQSETARRLGVSRPALIDKLRKYGLGEKL
jgi:two-component system, NtrC family, response regulator AtoC